MWHGNGNLDKAIVLLDDNDREDFKKYSYDKDSWKKFGKPQKLIFSYHGIPKKY